MTIYGKFFIKVEKLRNEKFIEFFLSVMFDSRI